MLLDNLVACFSPLVPEDLRSNWITHGEKLYGKHTEADSEICPIMVDSRLHASRQKEVRLMNSVNVSLQPLGPYMLSMNRKIAPLASHSDPEAHLPLDVSPRKLSFKRKDIGLLLEGEVLPDMKKRRMAPKFPRNAHSDALALKHPSYENDADRVEVMKEPEDSTGSLLIKKRGNVRFQLPKAETHRTPIDFPGRKNSGTLALYNSAFAAMTGSLPRVKSSLWLSEISDCFWGNSDGNEDSFQSTLVPTPSGSIDYTSGKTNISTDCDHGSSSSAGLSKLMFNPVLPAPVSDSDRHRRITESEDSSDINSGSSAYSGSEEEEQPWATIISEEEVERQLEVISESESSEGYRRTVDYKGSKSDANVMQTNGRGVKLSRGTHRFRDRLPGECIHDLLCSEDGTCGLLKVSIKTLLDIGSGSFQGTLLKPKTRYQGKDISFLRQV